jgi:hypothetical protein
MAHVLMFPFIFSFFLLLFVEIAHTDGGRGKVAGLRQAFSLLAQLTFVLIIGVVVGLVIGADAWAMCSVPFGWGCSSPWPTTV